MDDTENIIKAVQFVGSMNRLAECVGNGLVPFSRITDKNQWKYEDYAVYVDDPDAPEIYDGMAKDDVVMGMVVTDTRRAAVQSWANALSEICGQSVVVRAYCADGKDGDPHVSVVIGGTWPEDGTCPKDAIVLAVENGRWYTVG